MGSKHSGPDPGGRQKFYFKLKGYTLIVNIFQKCNILAKIRKIPIIPSAIFVLNPIQHEGGSAEPPSPNRQFLSQNEVFYIKTYLQKISNSLALSSVSVHQRFLPKVLKTTKYSIFKSFGTHELVLFSCHTSLSPISN